MLTEDIDILLFEYLIRITYENNLIPFLTMNQLIKYYIKIKFI